MNIKSYRGGSLRKGAQLKSAQLVVNGVIDCAMESAINIYPVITEANIFSLPFFINNRSKRFSDNHYNSAGDFGTI
ncbi:MAG: hypothetical protein JSW39_27860 [Desulfobacterales bacterium]|nr:MAG: hypothetical protein JSW39_27860 [Desulfobacterales bacterium]